MIRLSSDGAIRYINVVDNMIVAGSDDGAVRFYDFQMRILSWFEDIKAGERDSVSFLQFLIFLFVTTVSRSISVTQLVINFLIYSVDFTF